MTEKEVKLVFKELGIDELNTLQAGLFNKAKEAANTAYSPYSGFSVGAACLLDTGEIFTASNQENAAYPSGLCAERGLLFYVGANRPEATILTLAVAVKSKLKDPKKIYSPCGGCRQVMAEYQTRQSSNIQVMFEAGNDKVLICEKIDDLMPFIFSF